MFILGRIIGWFLMLILLYPMRFYYGFVKKCKYYNLEKLQPLKGKSFLVISNHIKPRNKFLRFISIPYDAFIIRRMLMKEGIYVTALTSYDSGKSSKSSRRSTWKKEKEQLIKGIIFSLDLIPLNRNEHDIATTQDIKNRIACGNLAIGVFPEGTWFRGFRKKRKLYSGVAVYSKKYHLPVLTVYLNGYNMNQPIDIRVGGHIYSRDTEEIMNHIRSELTQLNELDPKNENSKEKILATV